MTKFEFNVKYPISMFAKRIDEFERPYDIPPDSFYIAGTLGPAMRDGISLQMSIDYNIAKKYEDAYNESRNRNLRRSAPTVKWPVSVKDKADDFIETANWKQEAG